MVFDQAPQAAFVSLHHFPSIKWESKIIVSREKVSEFKEWFDGAL